VELGGGKTGGERERNGPEDQAEPGSAGREVNPGRGHDESCGMQDARLIRKCEIDEDAAGEQNRDPER